MYTKDYFNRDGSTLGVMDDLQIAVHTYDGCSRGCSGCIVDKYFKNKKRGELILSQEDMQLINARAEEYFQWIQKNINTKSTGYFQKNGKQVNHFSYTCRFGNHSELTAEQLAMIGSTLKSDFKVFSTAPFEQLGDIKNFVEARNKTGGNYYLEIIYDPVADDPNYIRDMILTMRENNILGYPEVLITQRLIGAFTPERFVKEALYPLKDTNTQLQLGRYSPSKTRNYNTSQMVDLDVEVEWMAEVARLIVENEYKIHPIPIGEYGVTFFDDYKEHTAYNDKKEFKEELLKNIHYNDFNAQAVYEETKDIFMTSLYIDHNLDVYVWSESMGQHVLDSNFGFPKLGNIKEESISEMVSKPNNVIDKMAKSTIRHLLTHPKCSGCQYKSFCASHAIPFFRNWHKDDGKHCYGYLPVIREFQKSPKFMNYMIEGFKELGF